MSDKRRTALDLKASLVQSAESGAALFAQMEHRPSAEPRPHRSLPIFRAGSGGTDEARDHLDKYTVRSAPVDCASRLPICQARCCRLSFLLTRQDVEEGIVRWDPRDPYQNVRRADGSCVHLVGGACSVYEARPAVCRTYDCRRDRRIWLDFEQGILAPPTSGDDPR